MNIDIAGLVRESLLENGCNESLLNDFDGHSTISLNFDNAPSILVSEYEGMIMLWSQLKEMNHHTLSQNAESLLGACMEPSQYSISQHVHLSEEDDMLLLKSVIKNSALNKSDFGHSLEEFYSYVVKFSSILN